MPGAPRLVLVDPRPEILRRRALGNVSSRLPRSPFGSMAITGTPSIAASSMSDEAEAGLAAAGHADADRVGDEIARVVEDRLSRAVLVVEVVLATEIEEAELLEILHALS